MDQESFRQREIVVRIYLKKFLIDRYCCFSDDCITEWNFKNDGFTALAHPSPLSVGVTHGVYVLPKDMEFSATTTTSCLEVLQKPSLETMREKGAVVSRMHKGMIICIILEWMVTESII